MNYRRVAGVVNEKALAIWPAEVEKANRNRNRNRNLIRNRNRNRNPDPDPDPNPNQVEKAYAAMPEDAKCRGFMFWSISFEGNAVYDGTGIPNTNPNRTRTLTLTLTPPQPQPQP